MDGSIEVDTVPTVTPAPQDISHWAEARAPTLVKKPKVLNIPPSQISGPHAKMAAEALRNIGSWAYLPGGPPFWNALNSYLNELANYAEGKQPTMPPVPMAIQKAVE